MAKKRPNKKHKFKHAEQSAPVADRPSEGAPAAARAASAPARPAVVSSRDFSYVLGDLRRISIMAGSLVILEFVLWYLFTSTAVGPSVYRLIHL